MKHKLNIGEEMVNCLLYYIQHINYFYLSNSINTVLIFLKPFKMNKKKKYMKFDLISLQGISISILQKKILNKIKINWQLKIEKE